MEKIRDTGDAVIHKGDPRLPTSDMDAWWNGLLGSVQPATARPHLYGSDAGLCPRKNVFYSQNVWYPFFMQPSTRTYMAIGVALENLLGEALKEHGRLLAANPYLVEMPEVKIRGKIDFIILDHQDEVALVEVKSCGDLPLSPNPQHLAQIEMYCAVSGVHKAYLTYISRKVQDQAHWGPDIAIRTFPIDCSEAALTHRLFIAVFSQLCIEAASLPNIPASFRKTLECRYCPFLDFCWSKEPRAGGGGRETPPVKEFSIGEELVLSDKALVIAKKLWGESGFRRELTLRGV